jgi:hypothetical protein
MIMVVQAAGNPAGPFRNEYRLESPGPVPRHGKAHRADSRLHGFPGRAVPVITAVISRPVVPGIAEMSRELFFKGTLENGFDQVAEHGALTSQPQPAIGIFRPLQESIEHLVAEQFPYRHRAGSILASLTGYAAVARGSRITRKRASHLRCSP